MTHYKIGDVVLVGFVFSEQTGKKQRPAAVISCESYNKSRQEIIIAGITSNIHRKLKGEIHIRHWKEANLLYPSVISGVIQTIKREMVVRRFGELHPDDLKNYQQTVSREILGLG
ncbi:MAG: type II toxin-antitoxin system PemK/MazF family toxin [Candidatus Aureabacteria bacterium]|nr:type II toxin-antitoxin system PemK/MazF family toxin [Candidatus Auribacterota bacterium]